MTEQQMLDLAVGLGFANAAAMDTKDLIFMPSFRPLCAENLCGKYPGLRYGGGDGRPRPPLAPGPGHADHVGY